MIVPLRERIYDLQDSDSDEDDYAGTKVSFPDAECRCGKNWVVQAAERQERSAATERCQVVRAGCSVSFVLEGMYGKPVLLLAECMYMLQTSALLDCVHTEVSGAGRSASGGCNAHELEKQRSGLR